jgi:helix-turn-helix protein
MLTSYGNSHDACVTRRLRASNAGKTGGKSAGQTWESSRVPRMNRADPEYYVGTIALGQRLRAMRGAISLDRVARKVSSSRSQLSRIERGEMLPSQSLADALDRFHGTGGDIRAARDALEVGAHGSLVVGQFRDHWIHHYPAGYVGSVWTLLVPHPERSEVPHKVTINWGPWTKTVVVESPTARGARLSYTKGDDGLSIPLFFDLSPAAGLEHGLGEDPTALDINAGWIWTA